MSEFWRNKRMKDGLRTWCIACCKLHCAQPKIRSKMLAQTKQWYEDNREEVAHNHRLRTYGLTAQQFEALKREQGECCAICKSASAKLVVDHDHDSGEVRGLLCSSCNAALGNFRDDIDVLKSAIEYLQRKSATLKTEI